MIIDDQYRLMLVSINVESKLVYLDFGREKLNIPILFLPGPRKDYNGTDTAVRKRMYLLFISLSSEIVLERL